MQEKDKRIDEKLAAVAALRPIDDVFFEVLADDVGVCQEMLRTILSDDNLIVNDVIVQRSERNIYGRSVRLDALCILGNGDRCNIEVQRADRDDHLRRVRLNASSITVKDSEKGKTFTKIPNVIVVYISEFDMFKAGKVLYHVDKVVRETQETIDDGLSEVFVNTKIKDGSKISRLMGNFVKKEVNDPEFPKMSKRVHYLKHDEKGVSAMCEVLESYISKETEALQKELKEANDRADRAETQVAEKNLEIEGLRKRIANLEHK